MSTFRFCGDCGATLEPHVVAGEARNHSYCPRCDAPRYQHPMVVVTCFVACGEKLLWIKRALPPQQGKWAIPGGYMEAGETLAQASARELWEEAGIRIPPEQLQLYMCGTITFINQIYVGFRATVDSEDFQAGPESLDCGFFSADQCPWDEVAYPEVNDAIEQAYRDLASGEFGVWQAEMTGQRYELTPVASGEA